MVSNLSDANQTSLLETDILVSQENLRQLLDLIQAYVMTQDPDDADNLIRGMLALFFEVDMHDIDDSFLSETNMNDLWEKVVGNREIASKLIPDLFQDTDYSFKDLLDRLPDYEEIFITNCQNIGDDLQEQISKNHSLFVESVNMKSGTSNLYYWVVSDDLQLFKGVQLD